MGDEPRPLALRALAKDAALLTSARIVTIAVRLLYGLLLASFLASAAYALFAYSQAWYLHALPFAVLGLGSFIAREFNARRFERERMLSTTFWIRIASTSSSAGLMVLLAFLLRGSDESLPLIAMFSVAVIARGVAVWPQEIFIAEQRSDRVMMQELMYRPLEVVLGAVILLAGGSLLMLVALHSFIWCLQAAHGVTAVYSRGYRLRFAIDVNLVMRSVRLGFVVSFALISFIWIVNGSIIMGREIWKSDETLSQLALALQMLGPFVIVAQSYAAASQPAINLGAERGAHARNIYLDVSLRMAIALGAMLALTVHAFGDSLLIWILGQRFAEGARLFAVAAWLIVPIAVVEVTREYLISHDRIGVIFWSAISGAAIFTAVFFGLAEVIGLWAAPAASCVGLGFVAVGQASVAWSLARLSATKVLLRPTLAAAVGLAGYALILPLGVALAWLVAIAAMTVLNLSICLDHRERGIVAGIIRNLTHTILRRLKR